MKLVFAALLLALLSAPASFAQASLTFSGDTSVDGPNVLTGIKDPGVGGLTRGFRSSVDTFRLTKAGVVLFRSFANTIASPVLVIWSVLPELIDVDNFQTNMQIVSFGFTQGTVAGSSVLPAGDYTIGILDNFEGPGGQYVVAASADGLTLIPVVVPEPVILGPTTDEVKDEVLALFSDTARNTLQNTNTAIRDEAANSFASRDYVLSASDDAGGALVENLYMWFKGSHIFSQNQTLGRNYTGPMLQVGADIGVGNNFIVGAAYGFGEIEANATGGFGISFEGTQNIIQPYAGWTYGDWNGTATLTYGLIDYDTITTTTGTAGAEGEMLAFSADVQRNFAIGDEGVTLSPFAGFTTGRVDLSAVSGSLAGAGLSSSVAFNELELGATLLVPSAFGHFAVTLAADYYESDAPTALFTGQYDTDGWSGSAQFEVSTRLRNGWSLDTGIEVGGVGSDTIYYAGSAQVSIQF